MAVVVLLLVACFAGEASAHASLVFADPRDGTVLAQAPKMVQLRFNESVTAGAVNLIDATGKWVTPGIVAGFSRLGLADVDLGTSAEEGGGATDTAGSADDTSQTGPFSAAIDVVPAINPLHQTIAVNRADGVTRAIVAPGSSKTIFGGQGAVIDTGADMEPVTAARRFQFVELGHAKLVRNICGCDSGHCCGDHVRRLPGLVGAKDAHNALTVLTNAAIERLFPCGSFDN